MSEYFRQPCPQGSIPYVIRPGDTFLKITQRFNTTLAGLVLLNPFLGSGYLPVGRQICIPQHPISGLCPGGNYYTVQPEDTLSTIAQFYSITEGDILEANPGITSYNLSAGETICLPLVLSPVVCAEDSIPYTIQEGDTFYKIAQRVTTTVDALVAANPGVNPNALLVGQQICVPIPRPHYP